MTKIYIIRGHKGEYSDYQTELLMGFYSEDGAEKKSDELNAMYAREMREYESTGDAYLEYIRKEGQKHGGNVWKMSADLRNEIFKNAPARREYPEWDCTSVDEITLMDEEAT